MFSLLEDLDRHALERPTALALASPGASYSYAELKSMVDATAVMLRAAGVTPRAVVAVDLPNAHEWIVDLALLRLATRTVSIAGVRGIGDLNVDVLITAPGRQSVVVKPTVTVDAQWFTDAVSAASGPTPVVAYPRPDSIFRIMLTSGTTGHPRAAAYSVSAFEHRSRDPYWADGRAELNFMALSTTGGFHTAATSLRHGQAHRAIDRIDAETIAFAGGQDLRVLCGSPVQVAAAITVLTEHNITLESLEEVRLAGASASPRLLRRIVDVLGVPIRGVYGSTEGGGVTTRRLHPDDDPSNIGTVIPGVELQFVDAEGSPLPAGSEGKIRYRSPGQVSGYLVNGVVEPFSRGWFESGDSGTLLADGSIVLAGRDSEVINRGGKKINPATVDSTAAEFAGVHDVAAFGFDRSNGVPELGIAVVATPECDLRELDRHLRLHLPGGHPTAFWRVDKIPRNRMGKTERGVLRDMFEHRASER